MGVPIFPKGSPFYQGKWGPGVPIFMGSPKFYDTGAELTALCAELLLPDCVRFVLLLPDCIDLLQLLLPVCVHFSRCSPIASASHARRLRPLQLLLPDCVRFSCCSPIASLQLLRAPRLRPFQLLLPDCVRFDCCSPIASACSTSCHAQCSHILRGVRG